MRIVCSESALPRALRLCQVDALARQIDAVSRQAGAPDQPDARVRQIGLTRERVGPARRETASILTRPASGRPGLASRGLPLGVRDTARV
jgi:hypothetical protein